MLKVRQVKVDVLKDSETERLNSLSKKLKCNKDDIISFDILKQSIDARDKNNIYYVYEFSIKIKNEDNYLNKNNDIIYYEKEDYNYPYKNNNYNDYIIVIGSGPAGLFASYILAENGYKVAVIERGESIDERIKSVANFWKTGILNENSNVQFGEGGAGTFSDGKLNTLVKNKNHYQEKVFETFVKFGAPKEILYSYKPHIGTDILANVVKNMRNEIIKMGGKFLFNKTLTNINYEDNKLVSIEVNNKDIVPCNNLVLAIGHSARDTFKMLYDKKLNMEAKPFAVGLRVQHNQSMIDKSQYGEKYAKILSKATYKLTYQTKDNRGVYSFCMCPGGYVVNASSEKDHLAINGMSNYERETENANSAIVVSISPSDFGTHPLDGIEYQRSLEKKAFSLGSGNIPVQLLKDYHENRISKEFKSVKPIFKGNYTFANLNELFENNINNNIKEAFINFDKKIKGFNNDDAILAGIESRTSSPVKIIRDENLESNIKGIYPCGEGAGYAGGITSAAIDGIKVAEAIGKKLNQ
jgi:hypothetical protein